MIGLLLGGVSGLCQAAGLVGNVAGVVSNVATVTSVLGTVGQVASAVDSVTGNPAFEYGVEFTEKAAHAAAHYAKTKKHRSPVNHTEKKKYGFTESPVNRKFEDDDGDAKLRRYRDKRRDSGFVCGTLYGGAAEGAGAGAFGYSADKYKEYYHK